MNELEGFKKGIDLVDYAMTPTIGPGILQPAVR